MKKIVISSLILVAQLLNSMDESNNSHQPYYFFVKGMVEASRDQELSLSTKKKVLERFIDDAPGLGYHSILDWVPAVYPKFSCNETDEALMTGSKAAIHEYASIMGWDTITQRRNLYRKKIQRDKVLLVTFFKNILDNKQLMTNFFINTRNINPVYPPLFLKPRDRTDEQSLLNNPQLQYIFLDTLIRFCHTPLRKIIEIQEPDVYKNAFLKGSLPIHLAVQVNWYAIVKEMLNNNSSLVWMLNSFGHMPEFYLDRTNTRMKKLLEWHKYLEVDRENR